MFRQCGNFLLLALFFSYSVKEHTFDKVENCKQDFEFQHFKGNSLFIDSGNALLQTCKHGIKRFIWPDDLCHSVSVRWSQSRWKWFKKIEVKFQTFVIIFSSPQGVSSSRLLASCTLLVLFFLLSTDLTADQWRFGL